MSADFDPAKAFADSYHDLIVTMQAAWIEWQHGDGADAAMKWIENHLWGPGLIPGKDEPYSDDAQLWSSANVSHAFGPCSLKGCGLPSCIKQNGLQFCSEKHLMFWQQDAVDAVDKLIDSASEPAS